jgi:hypothetical protein
MLYKHSASITEDTVKRDQPVNKIQESDRSLTHSINIIMIWKNWSAVIEYTTLFIAVYHHNHTERIRMICVAAHTYGLCRNAYVWFV